MDVFEIGVALAAPEGLRPGLAMMAQMLAALDEAAEAGWAHTLEADRVAAGLERGAAPRFEPQAADAKAEETRSSGVQDVVAGARANRAPSMPSSGGFGQGRAAGHDHRGAEREQGDRSSGSEKAQGLKGKHGVHLRVGRGFGGQERSSAVADDTKAIGAQRGHDAGGEGLIRRAMQAAEALGAGPERTVAPSGEAGGVSTDWQGFAMESDSMPDSGVAPVENRASAAPVALVSQVGDVTRSGQRRLEGHVGETRRAAAAPSGDGFLPVVGARAQGSELEQPPERGRSSLLSAGVAAPAQENGREGGEAAPVLELDGRVIGQWLGEQMARDVARPGAGTTFFDPRQAPAWSPAGSL